MIKRKGDVPHVSAGSRINFAGTVIGICILVFIAATWLALTQSPRPNPLNPGTNREKFFYPYEENAAMRLPTITGDLNDVFVVPGTGHIWVVGNSGLILVSRNKGRSWQQQTVPSMPQEIQDMQTTPINIKLSLDRFNWGVRHAHAAEQKTLKIDPKNKLDVRQQPQDIRQQAPLPPKKEIQKKETIPPERMPETPPDFRSIFFVDENIGWIAGTRGKILSTLDGGVTWNPQASGTNRNLMSIHFTDPNHGWAAGSYGAILSTKDGGRTWEPQTSDTNRNLMSIHFTDPNHGWAAGSYGAILSTKDGGRTWEPQTSGINLNLMSIHFTDSNQGWAAGSDGTILSTLDGGLTWKPEASGTNDDLSSIHLANPDQGWAVGSDGTILSTLDGGHTWNPETSDTRESLYSIHFANPDQGWAVGQHGTIRSTKDGGRTWKPETKGWTDRLSSIHFIDPDHGWAADRGGRIRATVDGGRTWNPQTSPTGSDLSSIHFIDPDHGWAAGSDGTILSTLDGGHTWKTETSGTRNYLYSIHFIDPDHGWAAGQSGTILSTLDGGRNWRPQTSGTENTLRSIHFTDPDHGWAADRGGTILSTLDGGQTWTPLSYSRLPAAWYWVLCLLLILISLFVLKRQGQPEQAGETVADLLASDRPLEAGDPDPLNLHTISSGLARFIANINTEPPLTIAVTGEWGTGKSSLMNLLYHDLKQRRFHPVWFNAWHHQKGEQLLASLYANIRQQAVPPLWHPTGILFRLRLLFRRGRQNWLAFGILTFLFFAAWPFLTDIILSITGSMAALVKALVEKDMESAAKIFSFAQLKSAVQGNWINALIASPAVAATLRGVRAFGLSPQRLLAFGTSEGGSKPGLDPGARTRFAREFEDVAASLDLGAMVIFIDDLDRCSKENVVEILETINFLAVSGRCFIILGMARQWVETCVALQFKELAEETGNEKNRQGDGYDHRQRFARQYLEKLINIEVPVPIPSSEDAKALLAPQTPEPTSAMVRMMTAVGKATRKYTPILCLILLAWLSWFLADKGLFKAPPKQKSETPSKELLVLPASSQPGELILNDGSLRIPLNAIPGQTDDTHDRSLEIVLKGKENALEKGIAIGRLGKAGESAELLLRYKPEPIKKTASSTSERQKVSQPKAPDQKPSETNEFRPGAEDNGITARWLVLLAGLGLIMIGVVYLVQRPRRFTADSKTFRDALDIWHPWIILSRRTPRTIKRFLNRLRYVAMRLRSEPERLSQWERMKRRFTGQGPVNRPIEVQEGVPEPILVALGAISHVNPDWVKDTHTLQQLFAADAQGIVSLLKTAFPESTGQSERALETAMGLSDVIIKYKKEFSQDADMLIRHRQAFLEVLAETGI